MPNGNPAPGPLNSRYFRPVRGKETRARRWDLQFESTSLPRGVRCELAGCLRPQARRYGGATAVVDWRERLVCSRCGSRQVDMVVSGTKRR